MTATLGELVQKQKVLVRSQTRHTQLIELQRLRVDSQGKALDISMGVGTGARAVADAALALAQANEPKIISIDNADSPYSAIQNYTIHVDMSAGNVVVNLPTESIYPVAIIRTGGDLNSLSVVAPSGYTVEGEASKTIDYDGTGIVLAVDTDHDWRRK